MIILLTGASHTGKTAFAQKLLEKYQYPYLSIDHLKMGLIRSENTKLTPMSENYMRTHFADIKDYANVVEKRLEDDCTLESILEENKQMFKMAKQYDVNYILIDDKYEIDLEA